LGTYSRGGLIGLAIIAGALFLKSRRRLAVALVAVAVGLVAYHFMPPEWAARMDTLHQATETSSGESRIQSWEFAANVALHHPFLGGGFDDYLSTSLWDAFAPEGAEQRAIHSIYFRVLGEQGFPGLALFLALVFASWRNCSRVRKSVRNLPEQKWAYDLASMLQVALIAFMAAGAFLPMTYFDLSYQLMAVCALLGLHVQESGAQLAGERSHGSGVAVPPSPAHGAVAESRP
jgi:probable O-glycosylation ligase (exosortase A-associated)